MSDWTKLKRKFHLNEYLIIIGGDVKDFTDACQNIVYMYLALGNMNSNMKCIENRAHLRDIGLYHIKSHLDLMLLDFA